MYQDRIEYLKRAIKRTHKQYTGERKDGEASIKDVAHFFNIPIDEERMEDYSVSAIDYNTPSIEIIDRRTETTYISKYTNNAKLLNHYASGQPQFNCLIAITPTHKIDSLYYIGSENPIIEKLTIKEGDYNLEFEREFPNIIGFFRNDEILLTISYIQNIKHKGRDVEQRLLTKVYSKSPNDNSTNSFEQTYTYGPPFAVKRNDSQDKYTYIRNNNVIYGIGELSQRLSNCYLRGHCFENTLDKTIDYYSFDINTSYYPELNDENTTSAMIFSGYSEEQSHFVKIYKTGSEAIINYSKRHEGELASEETRIELSQTGNITSTEVQLVAAALQDKYNDDVYISLVSNELMNFSKRIDIKNGKIEEDIDLLNPKLYIDKPLEETAEIIEENKDEFMKTIQTQFEAATNISQTNKSTHKRVIKPEEN